MMKAQWKSATLEYLNCSATQLTWFKISVAHQPIWLLKCLSALRSSADNRLMFGVSEFVSSQCFAEGYLSKEEASLNSRIALLASLWNIPKISNRSCQESHVIWSRKCWLRILSKGQQWLKFLNTRGSMADQRQWASLANQSWRK